MSDDDRDIDIESDNDTDPESGGKQEFNQESPQNVSQAEKRAHHNALERKRRDHIKDSFSSLRETVPSLKGEKASRAQILRKTADCINMLVYKIQSHRKNVEEMKKQNALLNAQIRLLEKTRDDCMVESNDLQVKPVEESGSSNADAEDLGRKSKKMKTTMET